VHCAVRTVGDENKDVRQSRSALRRQRQRRELEQQQRRSSRKHHDASRESESSPDCPRADEGFKGFLF
jgi:hypothetical protein